MRPANSKKEPFNLKANVIRISNHHLPSRSAPRAIRSNANQPSSTPQPAQEKKKKKKETNMGVDEASLSRKGGEEKTKARQSPPSNRVETKERKQSKTDARKAFRDYMRFERESLEKINHFFNSPAWPRKASEMERVWTIERPGLTASLYTDMRTAIEAFSDPTARANGMKALDAWLEGMTTIEGAYFELRDAERRKSLDVKEKRKAYLDTWIGYAANVQIPMKDVEEAAALEFRMRFGDPGHLFIGSVLENAHTVKGLAKRFGTRFEAIQRVERETLGTSVTAIYQRVEDLSHPAGVMAGLWLPDGVRAHDLTAAERELVMTDTLVSSAVRHFTNTMSNVADSAFRVYGIEIPVPEDANEEEGGRSSDAGDDPAAVLNKQMHHAETVIRAIDRAKHKEGYVAEPMEDLFLGILFSDRTQLGAMLDQFEAPPLKGDQAATVAYLKRMQGRYITALRESFEKETRNKVPNLRADDPIAQKRYTDRRLQLALKMLLGDEAEGSGLFEKKVPKHIRDRSIRPSIQRYLATNRHARWSLILQRILQALELEGGSARGGKDDDDHPHSRLDAAASLLYQQLLSGQHPGRRGKGKGGQRQEEEQEQGKENETKHFKVGRVSYFLIMLLVLILGAIYMFFVDYEYSAELTLLVGTTTLLAGTMNRVTDNLKFYQTSNFMQSAIAENLVNMQRNVEAFEKELDESHLTAQNRIDQYMRDTIQFIGVAKNIMQSLGVIVVDQKKRYEAQSDLLAIMDRLDPLIRLGITHQDSRRSRDGTEDNCLLVQRTLNAMIEEHKRLGREIFQNSFVSEGNLTKMVNDGVREAVKGIDLDACVIESGFTLNFAFQSYVHQLRVDIQAFIQSIQKAIDQHGLLRTERTPSADTIVSPERMSEGAKLALSDAAAAASSSSSSSNPKPSADVVQFLEMVDKFSQDFDRLEADAYRLAEETERLSHTTKESIRKEVTSIKETLRANFTKVTDVLRGVSSSQVERLRREVELLRSIHRTFPREQSKAAAVYMSEKWRLDKIELDGRSPYACYTNDTLAETDLKCAAFFGTNALAQQPSSSSSSSSLPISNPYNLTAEHVVKLAEEAVFAQARNESIEPLFERYGSSIDGNDLDRLRSDLQAMAETTEVEIAPIGRGDEKQPQWMIYNVNTKPYSVDNLEDFTEKLLRTSYLLEMIINQSQEKYQSSYSASPSKVELPPPPKEPGYFQSMLESSGALAHRALVFQSGLRLVSSVSFLFQVLPMTWKFWWCAAPSPHSDAASAAAAQPSSPEGDSKGKGVTTRRRRGSRAPIVRPTPSRGGEETNGQTLEAAMWERYLKSLVYLDHRQRTEEASTIGGAIFKAVDNVTRTAIQVLDMPIEYFIKLAWGYVYCRQAESLSHAESIERLSVTDHPSASFLQRMRPATSFRQHLMDRILPNIYSVVLTTCGFAVVGGYLTGAFSAGTIADLSKAMGITQWLLIGLLDLLKNNTMLGGWETFSDYWSRDFLEAIFWNLVKVVATLGGGGLALWNAPALIRNVFFPLIRRIPQHLTPRNLSTTAATYIVSVYSNERMGPFALEIIYQFMVMRTLPEVLRVGAELLYVLWPVDPPGDIRKFISGTKLSSSVEAAKMLLKTTPSGASKVYYEELLRAYVLFDPDDKEMLEEKRLEFQELLEKFQGVQSTLLSGIAITEALSQTVLNLMILLGILPRFITGKWSGKLHAEPPQTTRATATTTTMSSPTLPSLVDGQPPNEIMAITNYLQQSGPQAIQQLEIFVDKSIKTIGRGGGGSPGSPSSSSH
jgi:hypothetical protein